ncbi:MAG: TrkH family potassium uptake protein [Planctomycetaceae bacterium]|nr:TrkH family potassium uptake protein [Planctomycetaceae bacterium]
MNWRLISRLLGLLCLLIAGAMCLSLPWSLPWCGQTPLFERDSFFGMLQAISISVTVSLLLVLWGRRAEGTVLRKEALAVVGLGWLLSGALGALPYLLTPTFRLPGIPMSPADAMFESVSGFTTTGASVLTQLERVPEFEDCEAAAMTGHIAYIPRCVLFWRSFTHWLGGMGIIVLFVAILGQLGAGGKALMRREVPGPVSDTVRPRIRDTAVVMWGIYLGLSVLLTILLMLQQMSLFDALCHTFGTMATGGFSTRNLSVGAYSDPVLELTIIVFMVAAGVNFNLYYLLLYQSADLRQLRFRSRLTRFLRDPELRLYGALIAIATLMISASLVHSGQYTAGDAVRHSAFSVVTIITTTGFGTEDFVQWPAVTHAILLVLMYVGGCSGSTGGGIKVIRILILFRLLKLEIEKAFRPNLVKPLRVSGGRVPDLITHNILVYTALIAVISVISWMLIVFLEPSVQWDRTTGRGGEKLLDCGSAVVATLNNIGPGIGVCGPHGNYTSFTELSKLVMTVLMLLGRLELFAIIVLFVPSFWKNE